MNVTLPSGIVFKVGIPSSKVLVYIYLRWSIFPLIFQLFFALISAIQTPPVFPDRHGARPEIFISAFSMQTILHDHQRAVFIHVFAPDL